MLSITTDYIKSMGSPEPYLRRIAEAGFSHIHWCHQWNTDFIYADAEIEQIAKWLKDYGLQLTDLHASAGMEKYWLSYEEYERLAGVELVKNRIAMTARLGSDVIVMHVPAEPEANRGDQKKVLFWAQLQKSLDALEPYAKAHGVRIAVENLTTNFDTLQKLFTQYSADYLGLCYDSGHANIRGDRMDRLAACQERLISLHLHDNDGTGDQHKLLFSGTVDWSRLAGIIATSAYTKWVSMEVSIHNTGIGIEDEDVFLEKSFETGRTFAGLIEKFR